MSASLIASKSITEGWEMASAAIVVDYFLYRNARPTAFFTLLHFYHPTFLRRDRPLRFPEPSLANWEPSLER